jgi:fructose-1,6-bisphosphatase/inositol monophosphatase family enzyme
VERDPRSALTSPSYVLPLLQDIQDRAMATLLYDPETALKQYYYDTVGGRKELIYVDAIAEGDLRSRILRDFKNSVRVLGEESFFSDEPVDLRSEQRICVLADMIDGTDLFRRHFSNWCSALAVYEPAERRILATFVLVWPDTLYYFDGTGAYKKNVLESSDAPIQVSVEPSPGGLRNASVCMYAQRHPNFARLLELGSRTRLMAALRRYDEDQYDSPANFRFYNLAGNPMMARLADGTVSAVVELVGQQPHDVVPGAMIALASGAVMKSPSGEPISIDGLAETLIRPNDKASLIRYVLGSDEGLVDEIVGLLRV